MKLPIVGLLSAACAALGLYGLWKYENLPSDRDREEVDQQVAEASRRLGDQALCRLVSRRLPDAEGE